MSETTQKQANIAYVNSQITAAWVELEAMKAANHERDRRGEALAYNGAAFLTLINKYQLGHNDVMTNLGSGL